MYKLNFHFLPVSSLKMALPIFRCTPALEVGIPVSLAIRCRNCVMPNARFHEKLRPGMGVDFLVASSHFKFLIPYTNFFILKVLLCSKGHHGFAICANKEERVWPLTCCRHRNIMSANNGAPTSVTSGVGACF